MVDVLFLLGLPASGKSEIRRFIGEVPPRLRLADFGLGHIVHIDDFPYVWAMRMVDAIHRRRGVPGAYFQDADLPFRDPREWLALSLLLRWDVLAIRRGAQPRPGSPARWLVARIERARCAVDLPPVLRWSEEIGAELDDALTDAAASLLDERGAPPAGDRPTYLVELARGGADWMHPPLPAPLGYAGSLPVLGEGILSRAAVLEVRVSSGEARRRNRERADLSRPGSILGHSVPEAVMRHDYGRDDLAWLEARSARPGTIPIACGDRLFHLPIVTFDNERDGTSFVRLPMTEWPRSRVESLYAALSDALAGFGDVDPATGRHRVYAPPRPPPGAPSG